MRLTSSSLFLSDSALRVASQVCRPPLSMGEERSITGISIREDGATCTCGERCQKFFILWIESFTSSRSTGRNRSRSFGSPYGPSGTCFIIQIIQKVFTNIKIMRSRMRMRMKTRMRMKLTLGLQASWSITARGNTEGIALQS